MTSVGEDFPRQQERVRKLWGEIVKADDGDYDADAVAYLEGVLSRAAEAQASGDVVQILRSYSEISEVGLPPMKGATPAACRVCGCTDDDCRPCIEATGEPCMWIDERRNADGPICSCCAEREEENETK